MHSLLLSSLYCLHVVLEYGRCWKVWNPSQWVQWLKITIYAPEIIQILSLWTAESDGCAQSSCQWQWKDHRWNELASDIPLHLLIQQNLTAVANVRSLWRKLFYKHLISSSSKFPRFSEWLLSQVSWDKEWLSPHTYQIDVQRVPINQCWRKASFKVCLLVSWERAIQWVCFIMLTAA